MSKKILIISGSPKKNGNTAALIEWFSEGAAGCGAEVEVAAVAFLKNKTSGCTSCRACQKQEKYECVIDDDITPVLAKMGQADVIVMATPLYFFSASAQLKGVMDRMFSLYKWDNEAGTMKTVLKGKTFVLLASAFEDVGLNTLTEPFALTAEYSGMRFEKLVIANARTSGEIRNKPGVREQALELGKEIAV
jgi:multimeric flavodoxin WrbA